MPKLSIVIPAYNEEHSLVRCIERVLAIAEADLELELLVVKVFRREVLPQVELKEKRFGFEPECIAQIARLRLRIYELGVSYAGYMPHAPLPIQFLGYLCVGASALA
jgi:hypothetical protein